MKYPACTFLLLCAAPLYGALDDSLQALAAVGREGQGNEAAAAAWKEVVQAGPPALPALLASAGKGTPVADNWLRVAGDTIVENARHEKQTLPLASMEAFLTNTKNAAAGRRLAF